MDAPLAPPDNCETGGPCTVAFYAIVIPSLKVDGWRVAVIADRCGPGGSLIAELKDNSYGRSLAPVVKVINLKEPEDADKNFVSKWKNHPLFKVSPTPEARLLSFTWTKDMEASGGEYPICVCFGECMKGTADIPTSYPFKLYDMKLPGRVIPSDIIGCYYCHA